MIIYSQKNLSKDSLKTALQNAGTPELKAKTALAIAAEYRRNNGDSSKKYLDIAYENAENLANKAPFSKVLLEQAMYQQSLGKLDTSVALNLKSINISEKINDNKLLGEGYNLLGHTFKKMGDLQKVQSFSKKGLAYIYKGIEYSEKANDTYGMIGGYVNAGIIYRDLKQFKDAENAYLAGLKVSKEAGPDNVRTGILYANLGQIEVEYHKNYDKAIELFKKGAVIQQRFNNLQSLEHVYRNLGWVYGLKKDYAQSIVYGQKAIELSEKLNDKHRALNSYQLQYENFKRAGRFEEALKNFEIGKNIEDSLMNKEKTSIIAEMETKFETVKKDAEIEILNKNAELAKIKNRNLIFTLILLIIIGVITYFSFLQKRKREIKIAAQEKAIEQEKRKNVEQKLEFKKKELTVKVLQLARKNEFLSQLDEEIKLLKNNVDATVSKTSVRITQIIKRDLIDEKQWDQFSAEFSSIHQGFIDALVAKYGEFSKSEIRLISLLKMNLTSKDIADTLNISDEGIKKARYRLRKKLNLESENDLQGFLLSFS